MERFIKWLVLGISIFITSNISAQWGINGGCDFSSLTNCGESKIQTGFHLGATYDIPLNSNFYFQPGLLFTSNGFNFQTSFYSEKKSVKMYALEVPLNFSFSPKLGKNFKLNTDLGLYMRYGLFGNKEFKYLDETIKESSFVAYNRPDIGLNFGLGLGYKRMALIGSYQLGLTNAEKDISGMRHKKIRVTLRYLF